MENRSSLFGIIAIIIGASGLGLGLFSVVNFQVVEGPQGLPGNDGQDGIDGKDAPEGIIVGIMDPDGGEIISGNVTIRAMIAGSEDYAISILRNSTEIGTSLPITWNTEIVADGWWNITIIATDIATNSKSQDEVVVYVQNVEDLTNVYYCSSQSEIEDALDTIGTGHGTIIITKNITLSSTIYINDGGNYIIQGAGPCTLNRNANDETFYISNVQSLTLKDFIIDTTDITSETMRGIYVNEGNNNPVYIQNVQIHGGNGRGVDVNSENVWIENCIIYDVRLGFYLRYTSSYCHVLDNSLLEMNPSSGDAFGIFVAGSHSNTISGNVIHDINPSGGYAFGIHAIDFNLSIISGNEIHNITSSGGGARGINLIYSHSNTISGNVVYAITGSDATGISLDGNSTSISDNTVYAISGIDAEGIWLGGGSNSVSGNTVNGISCTSGSASGIDFGFWSDYNTFTGNAINNIQGSNPTGIIGMGDYNVIVGNTFFNCGTGITVIGTGNEIAYNTVG